MTFHDLQYDYQKKEFERRVEYLIKKKVRVEVREISGKPRAQKNWLHILIGKVAKETGYTMKYVKQDLFKYKYNYQVFAYNRRNPVTGEITKELLSSEDPNIDLTICIERFRNGIAQDEGIELPDPKGENYISEMKAIEWELSKYKFY